MSSKIRRLLPLYVLLIMYVFINLLLQFTTYKKLYVTTLNPLFLILITIFTYFMTKDFRSRNRNKYSKRQNIIIIVIAYCLIYYLSGLFFGFYHNGYSLTINGIISNFLSFFTVAMLEEYIRYKTITSFKNKFVIVITTISLILINIDISYLFSINSNIKLFQYFFESILPVVILNITLTYLVCYVDLLSSMLYRGVITGITLFSPIIPRHEWMLTNFLYFIVLFVIMSSVDSLVMLDDRRTRKKEVKKAVVSWPVYVLAVLFVLFVMGIFKYKPIAIMSNSMYDYFARGDVVVIEKIKGNEITIKKGDIIYYHHGNSYITHRVVDIEERNGIYIYHTKGDNNNDIDSWEVAASEVKGIIRFRIKYLGWLSVWLYELL